MKLYGGIDLHSNNSVVALLDEEERLVYRKRLANDGGEKGSGSFSAKLRTCPGVLASSLTECPCTSCSAGTIEARVSSTIRTGMPIWNGYAQPWIESAAGCMRMC